MLEKPLGGRGLLLGGVPGVAAGKVMVIGGGVVGQNAAEIAIGMGAETYVYDRNIDRLRELEVLLNGRCSTCFASTLEIEQRLPEMDLVDRRGARPRRQGAARHHARAAQADEAQRGARRRLDRPGRLLRDLARRRRTPTRPTRSTASRTTAWPTCRARCRSRHVRAHERDDAVRGQARRPGRPSARWAPIPASWPASTSPPARSPTSPSRATRASSTRRRRTRSRPCRPPSGAPAVALPVEHLVERATAHGPEAPEREADGDEGEDVDVGGQRQLGGDLVLEGQVPERHRRAEPESARGQ